MYILFWLYTFKPYYLFHLSFRQIFRKKQNVFEQFVTYNLTKYSLFKPHFRCTKQSNFNIATHEVVIQFRHSKSKGKNTFSAKYERDALITASACYIPFITLIRPYLQEFGQKFSPTPYGMITKLLYQVRNFFFYQLSDSQIVSHDTS